MAQGPAQHALIDPFQPAQQERIGELLARRRSERAEVLRRVGEPVGERPRPARAHRDEPCLLEQQLPDPAADDPEHHRRDMPRNDRRRGRRSDPRRAPCARRPRLQVRRPTRGERVDRARDRAGSLPVRLVARAMQRRAVGPPVGAIQEPPLAAGEMRFERRAVDLPALDLSEERRVAQPPLLVVMRKHPHAVARRRDQPGRLRGGELEDHVAPAQLCDRAHRRTVQVRRGERVVPTSEDECVEPFVCPIGARRCVCPLRRINEDADTETLRPFQPRDELGDPCGGRGRADENGYR